MASHNDNVVINDLLKIPNKGCFHPIRLRLCGVQHFLKPLLNAFIDQAVADGLVVKSYLVQIHSI